jgi:hypothetical protein
MARIRVLKPFMFSSPAQPGQKLTTERFFGPGEHEVDDDFLLHPWIRDTNAEGRIESPAQTKARIEKQVADAKAATIEADIATANANAAFARIKAAEPGAKASAKEIEAELNTSGADLRAKQGPVGVKKSA